MREKVRTIRLYGKLGAKFGRVHHYVCDTTAGAIGALCRMVDGFEQELKSSKDKGMAYACFVGKENINQDALRAPVGDDEIRIAPMINGAGKGFQLIAGALLIAASFFVPVSAPLTSAMLTAGIGLAASGVVSYFTTTPSGNVGVDSAENGASYNFNGPVNVTAQGNPVPVLYGQMIVGSVTVSGDIYSEDQQ